MTCKQGEARRAQPGPNDVTAPSARLASPNAGRDVNAHVRLEICHVADHFLNRDAA